MATATTLHQNTYMPVSVLSDGQPQMPGTHTSTTGSQTVGQPTSADYSSINSFMDGTPISATATYSTTVPKLVACAQNDSLSFTLASGIIKDSKQRMGYLASNFQLQFNYPPQSNSIYTAGFSVCANGSLAFGGSTVFYQCLSGKSYNLYNKNRATAQCTAVTMDIVRCETLERALWIFEE